MGARRLEDFGKDGERRANSQAELVIQYGKRKARAEIRDACAWRSRHYELAQEIHVRSKWFTSQKILQIVQKSFQCNCSAEETDLNCYVSIVIVLGSCAGIEAC
jgi:hypothetical protein